MPPPPRPLSCGMAVCPSKLAAISCGLSARLSRRVFALLLLPWSAGDGPGRSPLGAERSRDPPAPALAPQLSPVPSSLRGSALPWSGAGGRGVSTLGNARCQLRPAAPKLRDKAPHPLFYFFFNFYSMFYPLTVSRGRSLHLVPPSSPSCQPPPNLAAGKLFNP